MYAIYQGYQGYCEIVISTYELFLRTRHQPSNTTSYDKDGRPGGGGERVHCLEKILIFFCR